MKLATTAVAAVALTTVAAPALAASAASATIAPLVMQLIDLDLSDGVAPSITFASPSYGSSGVMASALQQYPYDIEERSHYNTGPWDVASVSVTVGVAQVSASITGAGTATSTTFNATGTSGDFMSPDYYDYVTYSAWSSAPALFHFNSFTLSANTALLITAEATIAVSGTGGVAPNPNYDYNDYARATTTLKISGGAPGGGQQISSSFLSYGAQAAYGAPFDSTATRTLGVSFINVANGTLDGTLIVQADVFGWTYATAVPEPASAALMFAGLAGVGFAVQRRRRLSPT